MKETDAETLAKRFHETYEKLAPKFGYKTREASAVPWEDVPKTNKELMIAVADEILEMEKTMKPNEEKTISVEDPDVLHMLQDPTIDGPQVIIRLPGDLFKKIECAARNEHRSFNGQLWHMACEYGLPEYDADGEPMER